MFLKLFYKKFLVMKFLIQALSLAGNLGHFKDLGCCIFYMQNWGQVLLSKEDVSYTSQMLQAFFITSHMLQMHFIKAFESFVLKLVFGIESTCGCS